MEADIRVSVKWDSTEAYPDYHKYLTFNVLDTTIRYRENSETGNFHERRTSKKILYLGSEYYRRKLETILDTPGPLILVETPDQWRENRVKNAFLGEWKVFKKILKFMEYGKVVIHVEQLTAFGEMMNRLMLHFPYTERNKKREKKPLLIQFEPFHGYYPSVVLSDSEYDVTIYYTEGNVERWFKVHKNVLVASSSVFAALIRGRDTFNLRNTIYESVFESVLNMIYEGKAIVRYEDVKFFGMKMIEYHVQPIVILNIREKPAYDVYRQWKLTIEKFRKTGNWIQDRLMDLERDFPDLEIKVRAKLYDARVAIETILKSIRETTFTITDSISYTFSSDIQPIMSELKNFVVCAPNRATDLDQGTLPSEMPPGATSRAVTRADSAAVSHAVSNVEKQACDLAEEIGKLVLSANKLLVKYISPASTPASTPAGMPAATPARYEKECFPEQAGRRPASPVTPSPTFEAQLEAIVSVLRGPFAAAAENSGRAVSALIELAEQSDAQSSVRKDLSKVREVGDKIRDLDLVFL